MKKTVILFRHGQTEWNKAGRPQGQTDIPLNDVGRQQAEDLARRLANEKLDIIITSDLQRARMTGEIVAHYNAIPMVNDERLREANFGDLEGAHEAALLENRLWELWHNCHPMYDTIGLPHGEVRETVRQRGLAAVQHAVITSPYERIGISSHGYFIRLLVCGLLGHDHPIHSANIRLSNAEYIALEYDTVDKQWSVAPAIVMEAEYQEQAVAD